MRNVAIKSVTDKQIDRAGRPFGKSRRQPLNFLLFDIEFHAEVERRTGFASGKFDKFTVVDMTDAIRLQEPKCAPIATCSRNTIVAQLVGLKAFRAETKRIPDQQSLFKCLPEQRRGPIGRNRGSVVRQLLARQANQGRQHFDGVRLAVVQTMEGHPIRFAEVTQRTHAIGFRQTGNKTRQDLIFEKWNLQHRLRHLLI
ncbi:hypothetical protein D3C72_1457610 [compost metagenome]